MARPLRIEFPGALYHVTSRGDGREAIYLDDEDFLVHSWYQMTNQYHLLVETTHLSR